MALCWAFGRVGALGVPRVEFKKEVLREVLSLSLVYVLMSYVNSLCLEFVEVSFYQVTAASGARVLALVFFPSFVRPLSAAGAICVGRVQCFLCSVLSQVITSAMVPQWCCSSCTSVYSLLLPNRSPARSPSCSTCC